MMKYNYSKYIHLFSCIVLCLTLVTLSCVESGGKGSRRSGKKTTDLDQQGDTNGDGNGVGQADGGVTGAELEELPPKVELQHLIDPFDGTFVTKLTIPKKLFRIFSSIRSQYFKPYG